MLLIINGLQFKHCCHAGPDLTAVCETESKDPEGAGCGLGAGSFPARTLRVQFVGRKAPPVVSVRAASGSFSSAFAVRLRTLRSG